MTSPVGQRHYLLAVLLMVLVLHHIDRNVLLVLLEPIRREFALSDTQIGALAGIAYALPFAVAGIPLGALADRYARTRLLAALILIWSAFTALAGLSTTLLALLLTRAAVGAAEAGAPPTMLSLLADSFPARSRPAALSILFAGPLVGLLFGSLIGGAAAAAFGWRGALFTVAAPGMLLAAVVATLREPRRGQYDVPPVPERTAGSAPLPVRQVLRFAARHAAIRAVALGTFSASVVSIGVASWIPSLLMRTHLLSIRTAGAGTALAVGGGGGLGAALTAWLAASYGRGRPDRLLRLCGLGLAVSVPAGLVGVLAPSTGWALAGIALWAFASTLYIGPGHSLYLGWAPPHLRGALSAMVIVLSNLLGTGLGPQLVGFASSAMHAAGDRLALPHALACLAALGTVPSLIFLRASLRAGSEVLMPPPAV